MLTGISIGSSLNPRPNQGLLPRFTVGAGIDWLDRGGLSVGLRLRTDHQLSSALALDAGWLGEGLRSNSGLPLGFALGPTGGLDAGAETRLGGHLRLVLGLWYARAVLELDSTVWRRLGPEANPRPELVLAVSLRVVPWSPWRW